MSRWLVLFIFFFHSGPVWSQSTQEETKSEWSQSFAGDPFPGIKANINNENQTWPIRTWIQDYQQCRPQVDKLWQQLDEYEDFFREQNYEKASQVYREINRDQYSSGDCSNALWTALLVKASLLGPRIGKTKESPEEKNQTSGGNSFFAEKEDPPEKAITVGSDDENWKTVDPALVYTDYRYEFSLMVLFLANKGLIQKLNPHLRHVIAGDYPESLWTQRSEEGYFTVAFFDCYSSMIFIDSDLKPLNLAATLYHELDHVFRDKFYDSFLYGGEGFDFEKNTVRSFVETDELLATVSSGFYQRRQLQVDTTFHINDVTLGNEFNLYSPNGPLNESFKLIFTEDLADLRQYPNPSGFFAGLSNYQSLHGVSQSVDSVLCEMQKRVLNGYFSNEEPSECGSDQLQDFRDLGNLFLDTKLARVADIRGRRLSPWDPVPTDDDIQKNVEEMLKGLNVAVSGPSYLCEQMMQSQDDGDLENYLGSLLSVAGGRTGNGGVRPWLLPSLMVPLKPGEATIRPSSYGIRACTRVRF